MLRIINITTILGILFLFAQCAEDDNMNCITSCPDGQIQQEDCSCTTSDAPDVVRITSNLTSTTTWTSDKTYLLVGRIAVIDGVTLTIEPGTIIKGEAGSGPNAAALIIARGAKLMAEGTVEAPIIMTSIADNIQTDNYLSTIDSDVSALWGGLIILGNAPISADNVSEQVEGIPPSDLNGLYGGDKPEDNSGIVRFISILHGGADIGEGNEINGLTLGGVGSSTIIENIEIVGNKDDGIELFGGNAHLKNVIVWNANDDAIDTDQGFAGTVDNFIVINAGDAACELDGPEGSLVRSGHTLSNGTIVAMNCQELIDFDDNTDVSVENIFFTEINGQSVNGYGGYAQNDAGFNASNWEAVISIESELETIFPEGAHLIVNPIQENAAKTVGADKTPFMGWTQASQSDILDKL